MGAGLLQTLKRWWCMMFKHDTPDFESMRRQVRSLVHENRNLAHVAHGETQRSKKVSGMARRAAHEAISRLEEAKRIRYESDNDGTQKPFS
jgi:hypothetical protein